jgi:anti-sigma B factor antagonist
MPAFHLRTTATTARAELAVTGDIDLDNADELVESALDCLHEPISLIVIDLAGVTFMDSTGLTALVKIHNAAEQLNTRLQLSGVPERIQNLLRITGLDAVLGHVQEPPNGSDQRPG